MFRLTTSFSLENTVAGFSPPHPALSSQRGGEGIRDDANFFLLMAPPLAGTWGYEE
ncbi:MAG: hypothetical protein GX044_08775 [Firmicutes bacterium]|nr:hypothetical protein [Bacillota bacterium]